MLAASLVFSACAKPEPPTLTPKMTQVTGLGPAGVDLLIRVEATNPNRATLTARSVNAKAVLNGKWELGGTTVSKPVVLPHATPTLIDVSMRLPWANIGTLAELATATGPVPYVVTGTVNVGGERLNFDLPFSLTGTITREQILASFVEGVRALPLPAPAAR